MAPPPPVSSKPTVSLPNAASSSEDLSRASSSSSSSSSSSHSTASALVCGMNDGVVDPFRDTPIRYLGYTNEIGEAFRHFLGHRLVLATYAVASAYASADAAYKGFEEYTHTRNEAEGGSPHLRRVSFVVLDTMLWQGLASVLIPGLAVNRVVWATSSLMTYVGPRLSNAYRAVGPTGAGLASIPFMIRPIDDAVTKGMDAYVRPTFSVWSQIN